MATRSASVLLLGFGGALLVGSLLFFFGNARATEPAARAAQAPPKRLGSNNERGPALSLSIQAAPNPVPVGVTHSWLVSVSRGGVPQPGCRVSFDGSMPEHGHGLPTAPRVTEEDAQGRYRVDGMRFSMPGFWRLDVGAECDGSVQSASFELRL